MTTTMMASPAPALNSFMSHLCAAQQQQNDAIDPQHHRNISSSIQQEQLHTLQCVTTIVFKLSDVGNKQINIIQDNACVHTKPSPKRNHASRRDAELATDAGDLDMSASETRWSHDVSSEHARRVPVEESNVLQTPRLPRRRVSEDFSFAATTFAAMASSAEDKATNLPRLPRRAGTTECMMPTDDQDQEQDAVVGEDLAAPTVMRTKTSSGIATRDRMASCPRRRASVDSTSAEVMMAAAAAAACASLLSENEDDEEHPLCHLRSRRSSCPELVCQTPPLTEEVDERACDEM